MNANMNKRLEIGFVFGMLGAGMLGVVFAIIGAASGGAGTAVGFAAAGIGLGAGIGGLIGASAIPPAAATDED